MRHQTPGSRWNGRRSGRAARRGGPAEAKCSGRCNLAGRGTYTAPPTPGPSPPAAPSPKSGTKSKPTPGVATVAVVEIYATALSEDGSDLEIRTIDAFKRHARLLVDWHLPRDDGHLGWFRVMQHFRPSKSCVFTSKPQTPAPALKTPSSAENSEGLHRQARGRGGRRRPPVLDERALRRQGTLPARLGGEGRAGVPRSHGRLRC
jgi:hypothetical protein